MLYYFFERHFLIYDEEPIQHNSLDHFLQRSILTNQTVWCLSIETDSLMSLRPLMLSMTRRKETMNLKCNVSRQQNPHSSLLSLPSLTRNPTLSSATKAIDYSLHSSFALPSLIKSLPRTIVGTFHTS